MRNLNGLYAGIAVAAGLSVTASALAAPVYLQDYEAPGGLDAPFNLSPDTSGSSEGLLDDDAPNAEGTSTITLDETDGAIGTSQSAILNIIDEAPPAADSAGANGTAYSVRLIPNGLASASATNPAFATDGYVGFYLKADPSAAAALLEVAPVLEDSGGTFGASGGILKQVIADGQWHLYQWNMDDPADFPNSFETFFGGTPAVETFDPTASFDSIAILSRGTDGLSSATLKIDQIGYDNAGPIPEPTSLALLGLGAAGLLGRRRRA